MLIQSLFRNSTSLRTLSSFVTSKARMSSQVPSSLWKLGRLNHVAIATPDLPKSVSLYRDVMGASVRYVHIYITISVISYSFCLLQTL